MIIEAIIGTVIVTIVHAAKSTHKKSDSESSDSSESNSYTGASSDCNMYDGPSDSSSNGQTSLGEWM